MIDAYTVLWTGAFLNMGIAVAQAALGLRLKRAAEVNELWLRVHWARHEGDTALERQTLDEIGRRLGMRAK